MEQDYSYEIQKIIEKLNIINDNQIELCKLLQTSLFALGIIIAFTCVIVVAINWRRF